jgi:CheY-like chemotaxis protein
VSILIVEDQTEIRAVLADILKEEGYHVACVTNGMEALNYLRQHADRTGLILFDLGMPVMTGWEFREEQLRDPRLAKIPAIVMSALPDLDRKAVALNATDCLSKPIELEALIGVVEQYYQ